MRTYELQFNGEPVAIYLSYTNFTVEIKNGRRKVINEHISKYSKHVEEHWVPIGSWRFVETCWKPKKIKRNI